MKRTLPKTTRDEKLTYWQESLAGELLLPLYGVGISLYSESVAVVLIRHVLYYAGMGPDR